MGDETMEKRQESFVFYISFFESLQECPDDVRLEVYEAIMKYALYTDAELKLSGVSKSLFTLIKPQLDANFKRRENGKKGAEFGVLGGRPKKPQSDKNKTPKKPLKNPNETPNVNVNENVNDNVNVNENENVNNNTLTRVNTRAQGFADWLTINCPYIAKHYTLPTDSELDKLVNVYGSEMVTDTCQQIENRADLRKRYTNLYRTLLNWLKKEKQSNMTNDEREREKRLASYAKVANEFLNTPIRECETIPFDMER